MIGRDLSEVDGCAHWDRHMEAHTLSQLGKHSQPSPVTKNMLAQTMRCHSSAFRLIHLLSFKWIGRLSAQMANKIPPSFVYALHSSHLRWLLNLGRPSDALMNRTQRKWRYAGSGEGLANRTLSGSSQLGEPYIPWLAHTFNLSELLCIPASHLPIMGCEVSDGRIPVIVSGVPSTRPLPSGSWRRIWLKVCIYVWMNS